MQFIWKFIRLISGLFFAVTCFVGFIALMILNLDLCEKIFPGIVSAAGNAGRGKGGDLFKFLISCPIPTAVCFGWYKVFNWIDGKLKKVSFGNTELEKFDTPPLEMGKPSPVTKKEVKLGAHLAGLAGLTGLALIVSMGVGINIFSFLEKTGRSRPDREFIAFMIGMPILIAMGYVVMRHFVIKRVSNEVARPDR